MPFFNVVSLARRNVNQPRKVEGYGAISIGRDFIGEFTAIHSQPCHGVLIHSGDREEPRIRAGSLSSTGFTAERR